MSWAWTGCAQRSLVVWVAEGEAVRCNAVVLLTAQGAAEAAEEVEEEEYRSDLWRQASAAFVQAGR